LIEISQAQEFTVSDDAHARLLACRCGPQTNDVSFSHATYVSLGRQDEPLTGRCSFEEWVMSEEICTGGPLCIGKKRIKAIHLFDFTVVKAPPECQQNLFKPFPNPFAASHKLGPFRVGDRVSEIVAGWFTDNALDYATTGISFLSLQPGTLPALAGTVPAGTVPATYFGTVTAQNPKGAAVVQFSVVIQ
jgi:hypothetical protein